MRFATWFQFAPLHVAIIVVALGLPLPWMHRTELLLCDDYFMCYSLAHCHPVFRMPFSLTYGACLPHATQFVQMKYSRNAINRAACARPMPPRRSTCGEGCLGYNSSIGVLPEILSGCRSPPPPLPPKHSGTHVHATQQEPAASCDKTSSLFP